MLKGVTLKSIEHRVNFAGDEGEAVACVEIELLNREGVKEEARRFFSSVGMRDLGERLYTLKGTKKVEKFSLEDLKNILAALVYPLKVEGGVFDYTLIDNSVVGGGYRKKMDMREGRNVSESPYESNVWMFLKFNLYMEQV